MRIAFTGPQGSGKSTILQQCRESWLFKDYVLVPSATRMLRDKYNLKINQESNDVTQKYIADWYKDQHENHHYKNVIYDRCVLDGTVYTNYLMKIGKVTEDAYKYIEDVFLKYIKDYDLIFYTMPLPLVADGTRSMDEQYLKDIHNTFLEYIEKYKIPAIKLEGNKEKRFNTVISMVNYCNAIERMIIDKINVNK